MQVLVPYIGIGLLCSIRAAFEGWKDRSLSTAELIFILVWVMVAWPIFLVAYLCFLMDKKRGVRT
jgi:hypothetical protein